MEEGILTSALRHNYVAGKRATEVGTSMLKLKENAV
jgi:hypothetical protein